MKHFLLTTIAAVLVVGCGESQQSAPAPEVKPVELVAEAATPEPPTAKVPDISIHKAAFNGNIEAVKQHLAAGTDMNAEPVDPPFGTPFVLAVHGGHKEIVELLIAEGADVNLKDQFDSTPLHLASLRGHKEVAELLIAKGADVNAKNDNDGTPLRDAAEGGRKKTAELLIAKGADVNAKDIVGNTPLDWAIMNDHTETADLFRKHDGKYSTINWAATAGDAEAVKEFLAAGTEVNAAEEDGSTPLHSAAREGHKEIAELLIAKGANVNAKNKRGDTSLNWAISRKHTEIADLLRKHGGKTGEELKAEGK